MALSYKKTIRKKLTYIPKDKLNKHKHDYSIHCVLEVTNQNIRATANYCNIKQYYNVLKCNLCDSFLAASEEGNISGNILDENYNKELPLIMANTNIKNQLYDFSSLYDVIIKK